MIEPIENNLEAMVDYPKNLFIKTQKYFHVKLN